LQPRPLSLDWSVAGMSVAALLDGVRRTPGAPGGGSVSCVAVALAAALVEMAARQSPAGVEADGAVAQAAALRRTALRLALEDAHAFHVADAALTQAPGGEQEDRDAALARALERAAAVPLAITEAAADVVQLGAVVADITRDDRRADVAVAAMLGEAACAAAAHLVEVNLATTAGDARRAQAQATLEAARGARAQALDTSLQAS
jgi:formiminotetrahydrofolate cyclodeaminase